MFVNDESINFKDENSYHFNAGYFTACYIFSIFSRYLFSKRTLFPNEYIYEDEGVIRIAFEVYYYVLAFFIIFSN
jgi:hypothetical protein